MGTKGIREGARFVSVIELNPLDQSYPVARLGENIFSETSLFNRPSDTFLSAPPLAVTSERLQEDGSLWSQHKFMGTSAVGLPDSTKGQETKIRWESVEVLNNTLSERPNTFGELGFTNSRSERGT